MLVLFKNVCCVTHFHNMQDVTLEICWYCCRGQQTKKTENLVRAYLHVCIDVPVYSQWLM